MGVDAVSTTLVGYVPGALYLEDELYKTNLKLVKAIAYLQLPCALVSEWDIRSAIKIGLDEM